MHNNKIKLVKDFGSTTAYFMLDLILGLADTALTIVVDRKDVYGLVYGYKDRDMSREKINLAINSLKRSKYIEIESIGGQESIKYTNKAKLKMIERVADKYGADNKYRFISFDIPEYLRSARNGFRRGIKRIGFKQVQKSLWVCNKNVGDLVELLINEYSVGEYVIYLIAESTDIDKVLAQKFSE